MLKVDWENKQFTLCTRLLKAASFETSGDKDSLSR
jgi:hypothetical protein